MSILSYVLATFFLVFYGLRLWQYTCAYKDERHYAYHNLYDFPGFYHIYSWLALLYHNQGRRYEALGMWFDALELRPLDFKSLFNAAQMLGELGYLQDAWELLEKAKHSLVPDTLEKEVIATIEKRQAILKIAIEKAQIRSENQIVEMAKKIRQKERTD